jgi:hypothetical protein
MKGNDMQKLSPDYDNVFKTMKSKHKRLFISVINHKFGKHYSMNAEIEVMPSEGYLTENKTNDIEEKISDFLIKIENGVYILECQSYDDGSMAIRIAEYAFITARQFAKWDIGYANIPMPNFAVIYVKRTSRTPEKTTIRFTFPNGQEVIYESENVILEELTKEYIIEKRLFPYIPFYITRYEKELTEEGDIENAVSDLEYFRSEMIRLRNEHELTDDETVDLMDFVNTIVTHITNGNKVEERLVNIMGGVVLETRSEKLLRIERGKTVKNMLKKGYEVDEIADACNYDLNFVQRVKDGDISTE